MDAKQDYKAGPKVYLFQHEQIYDEGSMPIPNIILKGATVTEEDPEKYKMLFFRANLDECLLNGLT